MTDDEINRKVAGIEGWEVFDAECLRNKHDGAFFMWPVIPYATDWAWCGPLVEKYRLCVDAACSDEVIIAFARGDSDAAQAYTPQRAICLAVISAHEGKPSGTWTGLGDK